MKVIFATSEALCHWLDVPLPGLTDDQKRVDKGLLVSDKTAVSWQAYLVPHGCLGVDKCLKPSQHGTQGADLIFIGAYSRYVIICPNITTKEPEEIEHEFKSRLTAEMAQLMINLGGTVELVERCSDTIEHLHVRYDWFCYTAPNMKARFEEAKTALKHFYNDHASGELSDEMAYELGLVLNTRSTEAQILTTDDTLDKFVPMERILGDWLIRFGDGAHALVRDSEAGEVVRKLNDAHGSTGFLTAKIKNLRASKVAPADVYRRRKEITLSDQDTPKTHEN